MRALAVLDNAAIESLVALPRSREVLPEVFGGLKPAAAPANCHKCTGKTSQRLDRAACDAVKNRVIALPPGRQRLLKELLGAQTVRVLLAGSSGKALQYDF
jgi:hypothetical protein